MTGAPESPRSRFGLVFRRRRSYTLIELLITVSIIGIMASMVLFALYAAQEQARTQKTKSLVTKLSKIVQARYESYRTRRVPVRFTDELPFVRSKIRLDVLRDLMRMEMPDRWSDVEDEPVTPYEHSTKIVRPSVNAAYQSRIVESFTDGDGDGVYDDGEAFNDVNGNGQRDPTYRHQNAECLYLIVMETVAREGDSRDMFRTGDMADTDGDGFPEFVDAWGTPIRFLRWAPGFQSELQIVARGIPTRVEENVPTWTVEFPGTAFSTSAAEYVGGTLAVLDVDTQQIASNRMGRITGYIHTGLLATFTCESTPRTPVAFPGGEPEMTDTVVVLAPDPFDSRGVYPIRDNFVYWVDTKPMVPVSYRGNTNTESPSFALYPLVYSAGPDRAFGVVTEVDPEDSMNNPNPQFPLVYGNVSLNSCVIPLNVGSLPYAEMMGTHPVTSGEENFYIGCWNDNIHNHLLNLR